MSPDGLSALLLLPLNPRPAQQTPTLSTPAAGEPPAPPPVPPTGLGAHLSAADLDAVSAFLRRFAAQTLLPRLEERANRLNAGITAARRGLKNRISRMWKVAADDTIVDK
jgi:hypothetical protein